ncbi:hypothetical protein OF83DRAFT_1086078 [Amylostereum chailletii]|nr:hypothetical protein OF83DRAFT_1086078 [Amylostereum chailletii]
MSLPDNARTTNMTFLVAALFKHATSLRELSMVQVCNGCPETNALVLDAICAHTGIRDLTVAFHVHDDEDPDGDVERLSDFLSRLKSPIETLDVQMNEDDLSRCDDPSEALKPVASSLKKLMLRSVVLRGTSDIVFPRVTSVALEFGLEYNLMPILQSFPNVRRLTLSSQAIHLEEEESDRLNNQAAQERQRWRSLDVLEADLPTLYVFAIACDVEELKVDGGYSFELDVLSKLHIVLQDTRPSSLVLYVKATEEHASLMHTLLPPALQITHLDLKAYFRWEQTCVDIVLVRRLYHFEKHVC